MQSSSELPEAGVVVRHRVPGFSERWLIHEGPVPEAPWHDEAAEHLKALLVAWVARTGRRAAAYRNLAVRMRKDRPSVGFDPDVCLVDPAPPDPLGISSLKVWLPDHHVPRLTFELVSQSHPTKDYVQVPDQCASAGVSELVVFDPLGTGPKAHGGPILLQLWRRAEDGAFERVFAGDEPAWSSELGAWLIPSAASRRLAISDDRYGTRPWLTATEAERAAKEAERAAKEAERAAKEAALQRVSELEAELARRRADD